MLHIVTLNGDDHGGYGSAQQQIEYTVVEDDGATFSQAARRQRARRDAADLLLEPEHRGRYARKWLYFAYVRGGRDASVGHRDRRDQGRRQDLDAAHASATAARSTSCRTSRSIRSPARCTSPTTTTPGVTGRFVHATCTTGAAKCTPWGAINTLPFAALSIGRGGTNTVGDYESLFVDEKRRVLHALWAQPIVENDATVTARIPRHAKLR